MTVKAEIKVMLAYKSKIVKNHKSWGTSIEQTFPHALQRELTILPSPDGDRLLLKSFSLWYLRTAGLANKYTFPATGRLSGPGFRGWAVYMPTLNQLEEAKHLFSECRQNKCSAMLSQFPKLTYWSDHSPQKDKNRLCPANPCPSLWKQKAKVLSATNKASFGFSVLWKIWRLV